MSVGGRVNDNWGTPHPYGGGLALSYFGQSPRRGGPRKASQRLQKQPLNPHPFLAPGKAALFLRAQQKHDFSEIGRTFSARPQFSKARPYLFKAVILSFLAADLHTLKAGSEQHAQVTMTQPARRACLLVHIGP